MYEETLKLVQTSDDVSLLRQELGALRQALYRSTKSTKGMESTEGGAFERALDRDVRAVVAEALRTDLKESRASRAGREGREGREHSGSETQIESKEKSFTPGVEKATYSSSQVEEFLEGLEQVLSRLRPLRLTLAFEPTREMVDRLSVWFKRELRVKVVLEFKVDPTILGGVQLATPQGRFWDVSVAGRLAGILEGSRTEIVQYLKLKMGERKKEVNQLIG